MLARTTLVAIASLALLGGLVALHHAIQEPPPKSEAPPAINATSLPIPPKPAVIRGTDPPKDRVSYATPPGLPPDTKVTSPTRPPPAPPRPSPGLAHP